MNQHRFAGTAPQALLIDENAARANSGATAFDSVLRQLVGEQERTARLVEQVRLMEAERDAFAARVKELVSERDGLQYSRLALKDASDTKDIEIESLRSQLRRKTSRVDELESQLLGYLQQAKNPEADTNATAYRASLVLAEERMMESSGEEWSARVSELEERLAEAGRREEAYRASLALAEERMMESSGEEWSARVSELEERLAEAGLRGNLDDAYYALRALPDSSADDNAQYIGRVVAELREEVAHHVQEKWVMT